MKAKKYLIGHLARFGDCLYATTIAKQIKYDFPDSHITWAIASRYKPILELNPYVDKIWEIDIKNEDYYNVGWRKFKQEALRCKENRVFDEIIFSQLSPDNWSYFTSTLRKAILAAYKAPITVDVSPVIRLSTDEIQNVKQFANKFNLYQFKHIILFECAPGSSQSPVNIQFAINVAQAIVSKCEDVAFILTSPTNLEISHPRIIDGSKLSFRENAELTKYCTLIIGCSSGITWLSTSDWAKKLPMLQLLNAHFSIFAGVVYDFETNNIDSSNIIELVKYTKKDVCEAIKIIIINGIEEARLQYHQIYQPSLYNLYEIIYQLAYYKKSFSQILAFSRNYIVCMHKTNTITKHISLLHLKAKIIWAKLKVSIKSIFKPFFILLRN